MARSVEREIICWRCAKFVTNGDWVCQECALVRLGCGAASAASGWLL